MTQNLLKECVNILCVLLSLEGNRYHIPGESYERIRLKQKAQDAGIIIFALHIMQKTKIDWLSKYIESEFLEKLEEADIEYHQALSAQQYSVLHDILPGPKDDYISWQVQIEQILHEKATRQREYRMKQEKFFKELRERQKEREKEERRIEQEEIDKKRADAQAKVEERLKAKQATEKELARQEAERLKESKRKEAQRREQEAMQVRERAEKRRKRQAQLEKMQARAEAEQQEEIERINLERERLKREAVQRWHQQKREEERRRKALDQPRRRHHYKLPVHETQINSLASLSQAKGLYMQLTRANEIGVRMYDNSTMKRDPSQPSVMHNLYHQRNEVRLVRDATNTVPRNKAPPNPPLSSGTVNNIRGVLQAYRPPGINANLQINPKDLIADSMTIISHLDFNEVINR